MSINFFKNGKFKWLSSDQFYEEQVTFAVKIIQIIKVQNNFLFP